MQHGATGLVVRNPREVGPVAAALRELLDDPDTRQAMGRAGRVRAVEQFTYDLLAAELDDAIASVCP